MSKKEEIVICDKTSKIWSLPPFVRRFFIKTYYNQGGVYIKKYRNREEPVYCSDTILWLEKLKIETHSEKRADELSWEFFNNKYPQYKNFVQLF